MSYFVVCTFDLKDASSIDYQNAHSDLQKLGLSRVVIKNDGSTAIAPTTTTAGLFDGTNASGVCAGVRDKVKAAFGARRFVSEIFVVAAGDWAWVGDKTP